MYTCIHTYIYIYMTIIYTYIHINPLYVLKLIMAILKNKAACFKSETSLFNEVKNFLT